MASEITTRSTRNKLRLLQQQNEQESTPIESKPKPKNEPKPAKPTKQPPQTIKSSIKPPTKKEQPSPIEKPIPKKTQKDETTTTPVTRSSPSKRTASPATKPIEAKIPEPPVKNESTKTSTNEKITEEKIVTPIQTDITTESAQSETTKEETLIISTKDDDKPEPKPETDEKAETDNVPKPEAPIEPDNTTEVKSTEAPKEPVATEVVAWKGFTEFPVFPNSELDANESEALSSIIKTSAASNGCSAGAASAAGGANVSRKRSKSIGTASKATTNKKAKNLSKSLKLKKENDNDDDDDLDDSEDFDDSDFDDDDDEDMEDMENEENLGKSELLEDDEPSLLHKDVLNGSGDGTGLDGKHGENEKLRRRLPMSIKELIDYHSSNGKSIKEIVNKINVVCRTDEKVSYGYVQKYLYRKKLEATTAKKARYYRKKYGFVYRRMRRKPVLTENHRASRIQWCTSHEADNFDQDIFIGKTSLKPFLASLNQLKGQAVDPSQPRQQTTLHLWGAISRKGASPLQIFDGALTTAMYLEILLENVVPFIAENFPDGHRFHQDNNPKHSAKLSQEFLESTGINWVKSPPRSHDLNPIELVWTDLIQVVAKRLPKTIGQVVVAVKEYWKTLTPEKCSEFIDKLVDVVPKVLEKKGEWVSIA